MSAETKPRNGAMDALRLVLAFLAICLHSAVISRNTWLGILISDGIFKLVSNTFLVIGGYLAYGYIQDNERFKSRCVNLLNTFLFWNIIYILIISYYLIRTTSQFNMLDPLLWTFEGYYHLWYMPTMIFGLIILKPLKNINSSKMIFLAITLYVAGFAIHFVLTRIFHLESSKISIVIRNGLFVGFPLLTTGYLLKKYDIPNKITWPITIIILLTSLALRMIELHILYGTHKDDQSHMLYIISNLLVCPAIVLLVAKLKFSLRTNILSAVSSLVYLQHIFIIFIATKTIKLANLEFINHHRIILATVVYVICIGVALISIHVAQYLTRKGPFLTRMMDIIFMPGIARRADTN